MRKKLMNKIAIENGLAYIIEYVSEYEVKITGPSDQEDGALTECSIVVDRDEKVIKLIIDENKDNVIDIKHEDEKDFANILKDIITDMVNTFKDKTKFIYIKDGDNYTQIGGE